MGEQRNQSLILGKDARGRFDFAKISVKRLHVMETDPDQMERFISEQRLVDGALDFRTSGDHAFRLVSVYLRASGGITEAVGVQFDSRDGVLYDTTIGSGDLADDLDFYFPDANLPNNRLIFQSGDQVRVTCSNEATPGSTTDDDVFLTVLRERLSDEIS